MNRCRKMWCGVCDREERGVKRVSEEDGDGFEENLKVLLKEQVDELGEC